MDVHLFVWQPRQTPLDEARQRVTRILDEIAGRFTAAYGHAFSVRCLATRATIVGTIGYASNAVAPTGWIDDGAGGVGCIGLVEGQPGADGGNPSSPAKPPSLEHLRAILLDLSTTPAATANLRTALCQPGRWAAAAWTDAQTVVVNGAATGRGLWWTDGPDGWAVGSQARPLLDLVGRAASLDLDRAALSVALAYVAGSGGLYAGVHRLAPGERMVLRTSALPIVDRPVTLDDLLGPRRAASYDDIVDAFAARVTALVAGQLAMSDNPKIGLSGGRDSRLLAAAAVRGGSRPLAATGGPASSPDVVIARRVARVLGLNHAADSDPRPTDTPEQRRVRETAGGVGRAQPMTLARLAAWIALSDGTAPVSLAWVSHDLSREAPPSDQADRQVLTGLGGETHRGIYFPLAQDLDDAGTSARARSLVLDRFARPASLRRPVRDLLAVEIDSTDGLQDTTLPLSEWLSRFHWRFRENYRGVDTLDRADVANWSWAALMDVGLLALSRGVPAEILSSSRLMEDATIRLAPELRGVPYDKTVLAAPPDWLRRLVVRLGLNRPARRLRSWAQGERRPAPPSERQAQLTALWEDLYFGPGDHVWPELIDPDPLRQAVRSSPDGQLVKALAVPELLLRADRMPRRS